MQYQKRLTFSIFKTVPISWQIFAQDILVINLCHPVLLVSQTKHIFQLNSDIQIHDNWFGGDTARLTVEGTRFWGSSWFEIKHFWTRHWSSPVEQKSETHNVIQSGSRLIWKSVDQRQKARQKQGIGEQWLFLCAIDSRTYGVSPKMSICSILCCWYQVHFQGGRI